MYAHCIFCKFDLGRNEVIEQFPIGRRLAFDAAQGRLWAVCRHCNRWNLTPIEERWEAIESCERIYGDTRTQLATENIGLARVAEGTDLIRIGRPQRPEFAAWRYSTELLRRRRRQWLLSGAAIGTAAAYFIGRQALGLGALGAFPLLYQIPNWINIYRHSIRTALRIPVDKEPDVKLTESQVLRTRLVPRQAGWSLLLLPPKREIELTREPALKAAALVLPHINRAGANRAQVQGAVTEIKDVPNADMYFKRVAYARRFTTQVMRGIPREMRIALEMISHENQERRALQGELQELESMWREAEEIAAISDNLLLPRSVQELFRKHKR